MTAGAIIDPDLEEAIQVLAPIQRRLRQIEDILEKPDHVWRYPDMARMRHERADLKGTVKVQADKLNLHPRALMLIVHEAERVRSKANGRKQVSLDKLLTIIRTAAEYARLDRAELNAELVLMQDRLALATHRSAGLAKAVEYLEASRG